MNSKIISTSIGSFLQMSFLHIGSLIITIALTRILSVDEFGLVSLANTVVFFYVIIISLGVPSSLARYLAVNDNYNYCIELITRGITAIVPWVILSSLLFLLLFSYLSDSVFNFPKLEGFKYVLLALILLELVRLYIDKISHGTLNMAVAAKTSGYTSVAMILLMIPAALMYKASISVLLAKAIALFLPVIPMIMVLYSRLKHKAHGDCDDKVPDKKQIIMYGLPLSIISLAGFGFLQTDILFLAYYLNSEYVAYYSVAIFIFSRLTTIPRALGNGLAPVLARNTTESDNINYYKESILLTMAFVFPIILYTLINGKELLALVFGAQYEKSYDVLTILCLYFFIASLLAIINPTMDFSGKASLRAKAVVIGASVNIILDIILIPLFGIIGAALATVAGYIIFFFIVFISINREIIQALLRYNLIYRLIFAVIFVFIPLMLLSRYMYVDYSVIINGILLLVFYPLLLNLLGVVNFKNIFKQVMNI